MCASEYVGREREMKNGSTERRDVHKRLFVLGPKWIVLQYIDTGIAAPILDHLTSSSKQKKCRQHRCTTILPNYIWTLHRLLLR